MAEFKEQFDELFGPTPGYSPITPSSFPDDVQSRVANPEVVPEEDDILSRFDRLVPRRSALPASGETEWADYGKSVGMGVVQTGEMGVGALDYAARQAAGDEDLTIQKLAGAARPALTGAIESMAGVRQGIFESMTPEAQERIQREVMNLDPHNTVWQGGPGEVASAIGLKLAQALPSTLAVMLPAARIFKAGMSPTAITYMGASEASLSIGGIANGITEEISLMTQEELLQESPRYAQLFQETGDEAIARERFIAEAQGAAPLIGGALVGVISATAGRFLQPVFTDGAGLATRVGVGALTEAPTEGAQGGVEQLAQNMAAQIYDADRSLSEGVVEAAGQEALVGGIMGGGFTALAGSGPRQSALPEMEPTAEPPPEPTSSFQDVFGEPGAASFQDVFGEGEPVDPRLEEARALREDGLMDDMVDNAEAPERYMEQYGLQDQLELRGGLDIRGGEGRDASRSRDVARAQQPALPVEEGTQLNIPMRLRARGRPMMPTGIPAAPAPADEPTAEPISDIEAQLDDLQDPDSDRMGVYLSPENMARLSPAHLAAMEDRGFVIEDFDGKGGRMIARDEDAADELLAATDYAPMQEVLGLATGAGRGKPGGTDIVVQLRNENGAVIRESLVATPDEANQLADQWGPGAVVLTSAQALQRRASMIEEEERRLTYTDAVLDGDPPKVAPPPPPPDMTKKGKKKRIPTEEIEYEQADPRVLEDEGQRTFFDEDDTAAPPAAPATRPTAGEVGNRSQEGWTVTMADDDGNVIHQGAYIHVREEAEAEADKLAKQFPDANIYLEPIRGELPEVEPVTVSQRLKQRRQRQIEDDRVTGNVVRANVPFEERGPILDEVADAKTPARGAARLVGRAAKTAKGEEEKRVDGFFPPSALEFDDAELEFEYAQNFEKLVDANLAIELSRYKHVGRKASKEREALLQRLGEIKQMAKPRRKTQKLIELAEKVDPETVRDVRRSTKAVGGGAGRDYVGDLDLTPDQIDELSTDELQGVLKKASRLLVKAKQKAAAEDKERIGGFYHPDLLQFDDAALEAEYRQWFNRLAKSTEESRARILDALTNIRRKAKPRRRINAAIRVTQEVSDLQRTYDRAKRRLEQKVEKAGPDKSPPEARDYLDSEPEYRDPDEIANLTDDELKEEFARMARWAAGQHHFTEFVQLFNTETADDAAPVMAEEVETQGRDKTAKAPTERELEKIAEKAKQKVSSRASEFVDEVTVDPETGAKVTVYKTLTPAEVAELNATNRGIDKRNVTNVLAYLEEKYGGEVGLMRKFVNRQMSRLPRREHGGKAKAHPVTMSSTKKRVVRELLGQKRLKSIDKAKKFELKAIDNALQNGLDIEVERRGVIVRIYGKAEIHQRKRGLSTGVLTRQTVKADESVAARTKRKAKGKRVYSALVTSVRQADALLERFNNDKTKFGKVLAEKNPVTGQPTKKASTLRYGMAYYRGMTEFARSMIQAENMSAEAIEAAEEVSAFLRAGAKLKADEFVEGMSNLASADMQESLRSKPVGDDKNLAAVKAVVTHPATRKHTIIEQQAEVVNDVMRLENIEKKWKTNALFNNLVGPIMRKFTDSMLVDGYFSYRPSQKDMEGVQLAMSRWRQRNSTFDTLYVPLRKYFKGLGFNFDEAGDVIIPLDENGKFKYEASDAVLEAQYRVRLGKKDTGGLSFHDTAQTADQFTRQREMDRKKAAATERAQNKAADIAQRNDRARANGVITRFLARVNNPKTTINGLIRAEQRLMRALKALGMWVDTPSPKLAKVKLGVERTYRIVGPRLEARQITKAEAVRLMSGIKPVPIPARDRKSRKEIQEIQNTPLEQETEFFLKAIDPVRNEDNFIRAATRMGDLLGDRRTPATANQILDSLIASLPKDHVYGIAAQKLRDLNMSDVLVSYDWGSKLKKGNLGKFTSYDNFVMLNRSDLQGMRKNGTSYVEARAIHTVLHELAHAATHNAVRKSPALRQYLLTIRGETTRQWKQNNPGGKLPYGLATGLREADGDVILPIDEFVSEAFTNPEVQAILKATRLEGMSLWQQLKSLLARVLGFDGPAPETAWDAIMRVESQLFAGAGVSTSRTGQNFSYDMTTMDETVRPLADDLMQRLGQTGSTMKRILGSGPNAPLVAMTQEQIRDTFSKFFRGEKDNPMENYMRAFFHRNAENSRLMEDAERMSREWTARTETRGAEEALEFSRLATEATLYKIAVTKPLTHEDNAHLKSDEAKARHRELHARFKSMDKSWQEQYKSIQAYYQQSLEFETSLMALNALRATLTKGDKAKLSREAFDRKYQHDTLKQFDSVEKVDKEFGELFEAKQRKDMVEAIHDIISIPTSRKGDYFPLMRYGDYVVSAEKQLETKHFTDGAKANAYADKRRDEDPTLTVNLKKNDEKSFTVTVVEKDLRIAETPSEAEQHRKDMLAEYGPDADITPVQRKREAYAQSSIQSGSALNSILGNLEGNAAAQAAIKNFYLRNLADNSFRKHEIKRKNRKGVNYDIQHRNFTNYAKQSAYYTAQLQFGWQMSEALVEMDEFVEAHRDESEITAVRLADIRRELVKRDRMTTDLEETPKHIRRGVELGQFMMLFSPSYWMINATQPWMVSLPWMGATYGWGKAGAALSNAQKLIISPLVTASKESWGGAKAFTSKIAAEKAFNVLDQVIETIKERGGDMAPNYVAMLEELRRNNIIDMSWIAELRDIAEGQDMSRAQKVLDVSRVMAHLTEVNNRILTAIAAHELRYTEAMAEAQAAGVSDVEAYAQESAVEYAQRAVSITQFNYSSGNKARLFQSGGPLGSYAPWVFQFMQWPQHMYALLISNMHQAFKGAAPEDRKEARRILAGVFATHLAAGGLLGASIQPIKWALGLAMMTFGDDDEPYTFAEAVSGETYDRIVRSGVASLFGTEIGGVLSKGLPTAVGVDISSRVELGTLFFLDLRTDTAESTLGSIAEGFGGPLASIGMGWFKGIKHAMNGEYQRGLESLYPKVLKDFSKMHRFATDGLTNNAGDVILPAGDLPWHQLFAQALGFQMADASDFYAKQSTLMTEKTFAEDRKNALLRQFRDSVGNPARMKEVLDEVAEFRARHPGVNITRSSLIRAVKGQKEREGRYSRYGANLSEREAAAYEEDAWYFGE